MPAERTRTIAFLGLGLMGRGMAARLIGAGHRVRLWNRTRARAEALAREGGAAEVADTPAAAAAGAEVVVTMLADPASVLEVYEGAAGVLTTIARGAVAIDASTVAPATSLRIAARLAERGCGFLDAPVFGSKNEAAAGTLGFIVGGDRAVVASVHDLLVGTMGKSAHHVGGVGMGAAAKLVVNLVVAVSLEAWSEGMVLAARAGLDPAVMHEVLMSSRARSGISEMKGTPVLRRDFTPFFPLKLMNKDLKLALDSAHALGVPMPALAATKEVLSASMGAGQAEEDFSSIVRHLERAAGVEVAGGRREGAG